MISAIIRFVVVAVDALLSERLRWQGAIGEVRAQLTRGVVTRIPTQSWTGDDALLAICELSLFMVSGLTGSVTPACDLHKTRHKAEEKSASRHRMGQESSGL